MKKPQKIMLLWTAACSLAILAVLPVYPGLKPNMLMLASPIAIFLLFLEMEKKMPLPAWIGLQLAVTAIIFFLPFIIS